MGSVVRRVLQKLGEDGDLIWDVAVGRRDVGGDWGSALEIKSTGWLMTR